MSFPNIIHASFSTAAHTSNTTNRQNPLGQRMDYEDGRKFRYMLAGGVTLVMNQIQQGKAFVAGDDNLAVQAAWAVGATTGTITSGTSTAAAYYDGGWMGVTKTPSEGYIYKVKTQVLWASTTETIILEPDSPIAVALTTSSEVSFCPNPYNGVIVSPITTNTGPIVGVTAAPVTTAQFGWVQSGGVCVVEGAGSEVLGDNVAAIVAAEGRSGVVVSPGLQENLGIVWTVAGGAGQGLIIDLKID